MQSKIAVESEQIVDEVLHDSQMISQASKVLAEKIEKMSKAGQLLISTQKDVEKRDKQIIALTDDLRSKNNRANEMIQVIESLKYQLSGFETTNSSLKQKITLSEQKSFELDKQLQVTTQQLIESNKRNEEFSIQAREANERAENSIKNELNLKKELVGIRGELEQKNQIEEQIQSQMNEHLQAIDSLKLNLQGSQALNNNLKKQLADSGQKFFDTDRELQVITQQLIEKNKRIDHFERKIEELVTKIKVSEANTRKIIEEDEKRNKIISALRKKLDDNQQRLFVMESTNQELIVKKHDLNEENNLHIRNISQLSAEIAQKEEKTTGYIKNSKIEYESKIRELIKQHTKTEMESGAIIFELKKIVSEQRKILEEKETEEKQVLTEINKKFSRLLKNSSIEMAKLQEEERLERNDEIETQVLYGR